MGPTQSTRKWRYRSGFFMASQITSVLLSHPVYSWFLLAEIDESAGNLLNPGRSRIKVFMAARRSVTMTCSRLRSRTAVTVVVQISRCGLRVA